MLQMITAIIRPHNVETVKDALREQGIQGMTVTEVKGYGRQGGHTETYRGAEYTVDFMPKAKIEILADGDQADLVVSTISEAARSGKIGDGKIWVTAVDRAIRIRTGEMGSEAV